MVSYTNDVKAQVLGVPEELLEAFGPEEITPPDAAEDDPAPPDGAPPEDPAPPPPA